MNLLIIPFFDIKLSFKDGFRTRDAHIYEKFISLKTNFDKIIFLNRPTSIIEFIIGKKKIKTTSHKLIYNKDRVYISQIDDRIFVVDILVLDFFRVIKMRRSWIPYIYQRKNIIEKVKEVLKYLNIDHLSIYTSTPFAIPLCEQINAKKRVLDADDNFAEHKEYAFYKSEIEKLYQIAKLNFDCIACTNKSTIEYFRRETLNAKLHLIPNGVDKSRFSNIKEIPSEIKKFKGPIIGYAGNMQTMFDVELLCQLASEYQEYSFILIGNILDEKWMNNIFNYSNIYYLGDKNYAIYPIYINSFDICILPYIIKNQHGGDPIKFYEYMASNKYIISMNIGEIEKYHNNKTIFICKNQQEFLFNFKTLVLNFNKKHNIEHIIPIEATWDYKANIFISELLENE